MREFFSSITSKLNKAEAERWLKTNKKPPGPKATYYVVFAPWVIVGLILSAGIIAVVEGALMGLAVISISFVLAVTLYRLHKRLGYVEAVRQTNDRLHAEKVREYTERLNTTLQ